MLIDSEKIFYEVLKTDNHTNCLKKGLMYRQKKSTFQKMMS